jgi:lysine 6-dehydrogenase
VKILVLGSGLIGPAAAFNSMSDPEVSQVTLCDLNQTALDQAAEKLARLPGSEKVTTVALDLRDEAAAIELMRGYDAIVGALPGLVTALGIRPAIKAGTPLVDLTRPSPEETAELKALAEETGSLIVLSCGLEPGLTEIMTHHLADRLDRVDEVHIKCGGIPAEPAPPLGYKIVFGGRRLPLREFDARIVEDGQLKPIPRYSGVEQLDFPGVGAVEAWHEGFMPWLLELPKLKNLRLGTQKTIRWPGYAAKVTLLKEMGLLSLEPVEVDGVQVRPKHVLDAVMYPKVKLEEGEREVTLFKVEVSGQKDGQACRYTTQMVDWYDEKTGMTSMARTTAYTGAIMARMIARGDVSAAGIYPPEQLVAGAAFERMVTELAAVGITFKITTETVQILKKN